MWYVIERLLYGTTGFLNNVNELVIGPISISFFSLTCNFVTAYIIIATFNSDTYQTTVTIMLAQHFCAETKGVSKM